MRMKTATIWNHLFPIADPCRLQQAVPLALSVVVGVPTSDLASLRIVYIV